MARNRRSILLSLLVACAAGTALFFVDPARAGFPFGCPFHRLTGLYCPGCGSLRAVHYLLHGCILAAGAMNPIWILLVPVLAYELATVLLCRRPSSLRLPSVLRHRVSGWVVLGLVLAYWVARNIPARPFSYLVPGGLHQAVEQAAGTRGLELPARAAGTPP